MRLIREEKGGLQVCGRVYDKLVYEYKASLKREDRYRIKDSAGAVKWEGAAEDE